MPRDTFDETNPDLCIVFQALHASLRELTGGHVPYDHRAKTTTTRDDDVTPREEDEPSSSSSSSLRAWHETLEHVCRTSINATTPDPTENLQSKPWDIEIRTLTSLFNRFTRNRNDDDNHKAPSRDIPKKKSKAEKRRQRQQSKQQQQSSSLVLTSDMGVTRVVHSAVEWGHDLLVPRLEEHLTTTTVGGGWRATVQRPSGFIVLVSPVRGTALRSADRRPCGHCEAWPASERGLWWHVQRRHAASHGNAMTHAAATRPVRALQVWRPPSSWPHDVVRRRRNVNDHDDEEKKQDDGPTTTVRAGHDDERDLAFEYARRGDLPRLRDAVTARWIDPVHDVDRRGAGPLLWAAGGGHVTVVRYLVETCGCHPRQAQKQVRRGFAGRTALHWACRKGHLDVVRYLLEHCGTAALEDRTADGTTAVGWAAWQGQQDILEYLHDRHDADMLTVNKFGCNALLWAAQGTATPETMEWLVRVARCPVTHTNGNGHGVLHKAAQRNRPDIAAWFQEFVWKLLIDDDDTSESTETVPQRLWLLWGPDKEGCTPSDLAGIEGHQDLARQVCACEGLLWRTVLEMDPQLVTFPFARDVTALPTEYGPGCGVARLWDQFQKHSRQVV